MAVSQVLSVTEVAGSPSVENNTSKVRILWTSNQSGASYNLNTKTAHYYVSINGGAETTYSVSYTLPKNTNQTILDTTITVPHKDDGSATITVRTWMNTSISAGEVELSRSVTLTTIARASQPSCITYPNNTRDVGYFGDEIAIHMNSKSGNFIHKVYYTFGSRNKQLIKSSAVNNTFWKIPLDLINELSSNAKSGVGSIIVETYNGTNLVGSKSCEFSAKVPDIEATKPKVTMILNPVGALPSGFEGLYIQGLTKVKATLSADGEFGAGINSYLMNVDGVNLDSDDAYTSSYLTSYGNKTVYGYATDTREHTGETSQTINVLPYIEPKLEGAVAVRCDKNGNVDESGTYLKISAKRNYSPVVTNGVQKNFCKIEYRYSQDRVSYTSWATILESNNLASDEVTTGALLGGKLSVQSSYVVHIRAIDDIGRYAEAYINIPTDKVYMHRDGARNGLGLGKYNERDNAVDSDWDFHMNGNKVTGLPNPTDDTDAVPLGFFADYVIEQGTSGIWIYRKWASGKAECWGVSDAITQTTSLDWNVMTSNTGTPAIPYPFTFKNPPVVSPSVYIHDGNFWLMTFNAGSTTNTPTYQIARGKSATTITFKLGFYVFGEWK